MFVRERGLGGTRRRAGALVAAALVVSAGVVAVAPPTVGAVGETLSVSPSTSLVAGSTVLVEGTGWVPGSINIGQCIANPATVSDCDSTSSISAVVDAAGAFRAVYRVRSAITVGAPVDCTAAPETCAVGVVQLTVGGASASQNISFATNPTPGAITGTLASADGGPAGRACVTARGTDTATVVSARSGTYQVSGLRPGAYALNFGACSTGPNWATRTYDGLDGTYIEAVGAAAEIVVVRAGETTGGVDDTLSVGGTIRGRITDVNGSPLGDICVFTPLADPAGSDNRHAAATAVSGANGRFTLRGVVPGDRRISFSSCDFFAVPFYAGWYENATDFATATVVPVAAGETVRINASLPDSQCGCGG